MSVDLDDLGLDDLDLDLEDQFPDFDDDNENIDTTSREPLDSVKTAAMDTLKNRDTYVNATQKIAKNALPKGYSEAADGIGNMVSTGKEALEAAKKELDGSGKILRDIALANEKITNKILPDSFIQKMKDDKEREEAGDSYQEQDVDQAMIQQALGEIFNKTQQGQLEQNVQNAQTDAAVNNANIELGEAQVDNLTKLGEILSRMVSFNDTIAAGYYSKNLELQFKQYFALRDILKGNQAHYADTKTLLEGVVHNTKLPDILKSTLSEEYFQQSQDALLGKVNEGMQARMGNFFGRMGDKVVAKAKDVAQSVSEGVEIAGDILNNDMINDLSDDEKIELISSMAFESTINSVAAGVGSKLAKVLQKNPKVAEVGLELLYLKDNAPQVLDDLVKNGEESEIAEKLLNLRNYFDEKTAPVKAAIANTKKGIVSAKDFALGKADSVISSILPENLKAAYDEFKEERELEKQTEKATDMFADIEEEKPEVTDNWLVRGLKMFAEDLGDNNVGVDNTLVEEAATGVGFDLAARTALVDIIPQLLTESVRQLTILNGGAESDALVYDQQGQRLRSKEETASDLNYEFFKAFDARGKQQRMQRIIAMLDPEGTLDEDEKEEFSKALIKMGNGFTANKTFSYKNVLKLLTGSTKDKVAELIGEIGEKDGIEQQKYKNFFSNEFKNLSGGFDKAQDLVSNMKLAGGTQNLIDAGILIQDPDNPTRLEMDVDNFLDNVLNWESRDQSLKDKDALERFKESIRAGMGSEKEEEDKGPSAMSKFFSSIKDDATQRYSKFKDGASEKYTEFTKFAEDNVEGLVLPKSFDEFKSMTDEKVDTIKREYEKRLSDVKDYTETLYNDISEQVKELNIPDKINEEIEKLKDAKENFSKEELEAKINEIKEQIKDVDVQGNLSEALVLMQDHIFTKENMEAQYENVKALAEEKKNQVLDKTSEIYDEHLKEKLDEAKTSVEDYYDGNLKETVDKYKEMASDKYSDAKAFLETNETISKLSDTIGGYHANFEAQRKELFEAQTLNMDSIKNAIGDLTETMKTLVKPTDEPLVEDEVERLREQMETASLDDVDRVADVVDSLNIDELLGVVRSIDDKLTDMMSSDIMEEQENIADIKEETNLKASIMREVLLDRLDGGLEAIPVYMVLGQAEQEADGVIQAIQALDNNNIEANANTHVLLAQIMEAVNSIEVVSGDGAVRSSLLRNVGSFAQKTMSGAGTFFKRYYQGASMGMRAAGSAGGAILRGLGSGIGSAGSFLFSKRGGGKSPEEEEKAGAITVLGDMIGQLTSPITALIDFQKSILTDTIPTVFRTVKGGIKAFNDKVEDVYIGSEKTPRILASVMRKGGYFSEATGDRIYSHKDIDGTVVDKDGNVIVSMQEISSQGMYGKNGKQLSKGRIRDMASAAFGAGKKIIQTSFDLTKQGAGLVFNAAGGAVDLLRGGGRKLLGIDKIREEFGGESKTLDLIYQHLITKWPLSEEDIDAKGDAEEHRSTHDILEEQLEILKAEQDSKKKNPLDKDGDGFRDGSWQEKAAQKEEVKNDGVKTKEEAKKEEKSGLMGLVLGALGALGTGFSTLASAIMGSSVVSGITDLIPGMGGGKGKGAGIAGKVMGALRGGAAWAASGAGAIAGKVGAGAALRAGAHIAGRAAAGAAAVALGVASAPITIAIGVATGAYYAYKGLKWLAYSSDPEPLEKIRFLQYGVDLEQGAFVTAIRYLEEFVLDDVEIDDGKVTYTRGDREDLLEVLEEEFDLDLKDENAVANSLGWFEERFLPVLLHHTGVMAKIDDWVDIDDIDDEIDEEDIPAYLYNVDVEEIDGKKFHKVNAPPGPGIRVLNNRREVAAHIMELMKQYDKKEAAALEEKRKQREGDKSSKPNDVNEDTINKMNEKDKKSPKPEDEKSKDTKSRSKVAVSSKTTKDRANGIINGQVPITDNKPVDTGEKVIIEGIEGVKKKDGSIHLEGDQNLHAIEGGVVTDIGFKPGLGKFFEVTSEDGEVIIYKNLKSMPKGLKKGVDVTKGEIFNSSSKMTAVFKNAAKLGVNFRNNRLTKSNQYNTDVQDAAIAAAKLPITERDKSLEIVREALANNTSNVVGNETVGIENFSYKRKVDMPEAPVYRPSSKPETMDIDLDLSEQFAVTFNEYHNKSIEQRSEMITILKDIRDMFSSEKGTPPKNEPTVQTRDKKISEKKGKVSIPMKFTKPSTFI